VKKLLLSAALLMVTLASADAATMTCRIGGRLYQGRCPDRVAAMGIDGRAHWYRNPVWCIPKGRWGHC